ncbi:MAG: hypothetical protein AABY53_06160 [Bdellovibrionota bacterium]
MVCKFKVFVSLEKRLLFLVAFFFILQAQFLKPNLQNRTNYIAPPLELKYLNAGFYAQASDSFWIRAVQDMDHCDQPINERECTGKSWLFNVVNLTVELDQKFKEAYYYGALALTILISDYAGASIIFDKGVEFFNKDWPLMYAAGYHALFEEKDKLKASKRFLAASENGAPDWLRLSAGRLASEGGDNDTAKIILQQLIDRETDPKWIDKLKKKIAQQAK